MQLFLSEIDVFMNMFISNDDIILDGEFNIDCMNINKFAVRNYLGLLASFGLINHIEDVTREDMLGQKLTGSCLDHAIKRHCDQKLIAGVIKSKLSDHYFTSLVMFGDTVSNAPKEKERYRSI